MKSCRAIFFLMLSTAATGAWAARANDVKFYYYEDATHSRIVGTHEYYCNNMADLYGQVTPYYTVAEVSCEFGIASPALGSDEQIFSQCTYTLDPYPRYNCTM